MKKIILTLLAFLFICNISKSQSLSDNQLDSLVIEYYKLNDEDTAKLALNFEIMGNHYVVDSVKHFAEMLINLSQKHQRKDYEAMALMNLAWVYTNNNDYTKAIDYNFKSILCDTTNYELKAINFFQIGCNYGNLKNSLKADQYFHKSLEIFQQLNNRQGAARVYRVIAQNNIDNNLLTEAEQNLKKAIEADSVRVAEDYSQYGFLFLKKFENSTYTANIDFYQLQKCKYYYSEAMKLAEESGDKIDMNDGLHGLTCMLNDKLAYCELSKESRREVLDSLRDFLDREYNLINETGQEFLKAEVDIQELKYLIFNEKYQRANFMMDSLSTLFLSDKESYEQDYVNLLEIYLQYYKATENWKELAHYQELYIKEIKNIEIVDYAIQTTQNMAQNAFDQQIKKREIEDAKKSAENKLRMFYILIILLIVILTGFYITFLLMKSKKRNRILKAQKEEIYSQKEEIQKQNEFVKEQNAQIIKQSQNITDSINYGAFIQKASLPSDEILKKCFDEYFLIFRPLEIVSGDFYWANPRYKMIVVADCTGHGVPGAFVSMLGVSILNDLAYLVEETHDAAQILNIMRDKVKSALHQKGQNDESHEGMDIALIFVLDDELHYAGAYRPLIMVRDNELTKFDADKMPIGTYLRENNFTEHIVKIRHGDQFYMFSDGITDQFGKNDDDEFKKLGYKRLANCILENSSKTMEEQKQAIEDLVDNWKSDLKQIDDNLLIGFKI